MKTKTVGLYLKVSEDEKKMINELRNKYAVNISQAFRLFLKSMADSKGIGK